MAELASYFAAIDDSIIVGAFAKADADGSGQLELEEFQKVLQEVTPSLSAEACEAVFRAADPSGDGHVTLLEFMKAKRKAGKKGRGFSVQALRTRVSRSSRSSRSPAARGSYLRQVCAHRGLTVLTKPRRGLPI